MKEAVLCNIAGRIQFFGHALALCSEGVTYVPPASVLLCVQAEKGQPVTVKCVTGGGVPTKVRITLPSFASPIRGLGVFFLLH